ncbi:hypothetical protein FDECE_13356 [Fusarium decemcellulare]|nr:hypothetical protein FDECE_13356 [Fusarium decemcellulare]
MIDSHSQVTCEPHLTFVAVIVAVIRSPPDHRDRQARSWPPQPPQPPGDGKKPPSDHPDLPYDTPTCNRCKETKSLAHCVNLKDRNELKTRRLAYRDLQNAPSRAWTRFRSISRSTSAPPAPSKRNVSAVQSPEHPARHGVQPTSPEPGMSRLLLPQPAHTEPPALAGPPLRRRVASATPSELPEMRPQDTPGGRLLRNFMQRTASGIEFFRRDQRSQDAPDEAQARAEQTVISREHRPRRRAGEEPSPTPPLAQILEQHNHPVQSQPQSPAHSQSLSLSQSQSHSQPQSPAQSQALSRSQSQGTQGTVILSSIESGDGDDDDLVCELCVNQRPNQARIHASTVCASCLRAFKRREFLLADGGQTIYCRACSRAYGTDDVQSPVASSLPDSDTNVSSPGPIDNRRRRQRAAPPSSLSQSEAASEDILPDPAFNDQLNQPCLTVRDRQLIANWQEAMGSHVMQDIIPKGQDTRNQRREGQSYFWSRENKLDPGHVPDHLPELSQVEEVLIARVHVHVQVMTYRGQQYRYKGYVINFLKDIGHYRQLPLLPKDLDIIVLRPANQTTQPHMVSQFSKQFRVRQRHIRTWLQFLRANHSGYRDIDISEGNLSQLPQDGDVTDQLWDTSAVPNFIAQQRDVTTLRNRLQGRPDRPDIPLEAGQPYLEMLGVHSTRLNEFNRSQAPLSLAFPTLFPTGEGDIVEPRERGVSYADYIERLMKYHDGRFACHPRFPYVAFNTLMRQQVNRRSTYFVKRDEAKALLNSAVRYSGSLCGTRAFWNGRRHQLEAYCYGLGCPAIFLTFSAADLHWESLQRHMPRYDEWKGAENRRKIAIAMVNLKENPHIAAFHFHLRYQTFLEHVLKPKFNVTEFWMRYEWQARGSTHAHDLFWIKDAPALDEESALSKKDQRGRLIEKTYCRFYFPRALHALPKVTREINPKFLMFDGSRNDHQLNNFNRTMILSWLANIDASPCTSLYAVVNYMGKYCSKSEVSTESFKDIAKAVLPKVNANRGLVGFVAKFMNRLVVERDWSAQEVHRLLLGIDFQQGTRVVRTVDCRHPDNHWQADLLPAEGEEAVRLAKNSYQKYLSRPPGWEDYSYFRFLTRIDFTRRPQLWREFPHASDRILNYLPRYRSDPGSSEYEQYCRVKLMLHHPHTDHNELLTVEDETFSTYSVAYNRCRRVHQDAHPDDYYGYLEDPLEPEDDLGSDLEEEDEIQAEEWQEIAAMLPQDELDTEDVDPLGNRPVDLAFNGDAFIGKY